jgi:hypothetical protein
VFGDTPYFIRFEGENNNAIPVRTKHGLDFTQCRGEFFSSSHELKVALKYDLVKIKRIKQIKVSMNTISFETYVDTYIKDKIEAKQKGDKANELFAKLLLNSAYGKFGQNPDHYHDYFLRYLDEESPEGCELYLDYGGIEIWRKPIDRFIYYDVAVAASVTAASRSVLLEALQNSKRAVYCDTDSIICESLNNVSLHETDLGAWKLEGEGNSLAIAGKKLYALRNDDKDIKRASKGVIMTAQNIFDVAQGGEFHYMHDAPKFKLAGNVVFTDRRVRATK